MDKDFYLRTAQALFAREMPSEWQRYVKHVMPSLVGASVLEESESNGIARRVCARAKTDLLKLVSAHVAYITPRGENWFTYDSGDEEAADFLNAACQVAHKELAGSNFYTELLATIVDRVATGTGLMLAEAAEDGGLVFTHVPAGTYAMAENANHEVESVVRRFKFTAEQAVNRWGWEVLPPAMKSAWQQPESRYSTQFELWHLTVRRDVAAAGNYGADGVEVRPQEMSFAQVYIEPISRTILAENGFEEWPYLATRFIKYGNQVYGESALAPIVDTIESCLEMDAALKEQAKACAMPRILTTAGLVEEINMHAGGVTVLRPEDVGTGYPREWAPATEYRIGKDLLEMYHQEIDDALFISVLQVVSQVDRQMTATEVQSRESEKVMTFTQSFTQFAADMRPLMNRVFCLLMRQGKFGGFADVPKSLFRVVRASWDGRRAERLQVLAPGLRYIGRLAKALERNKQSGVQNALSFAVNMLQATQDAAWLDWVKPAEVMRFITAQENVPMECMRTLQECHEAAQKREMIAQQQAQVQLAQQQAQANRDNAAAAAGMM